MPSTLNPPKKTNVIYLVLDDMGFSDLGCFGSEVQTPNVDALAADGLLYNNFTVCPASSPTRASLLTGRDNNAIGMGSIANMVFGPDRPETQGRITHRAGTVAQILKKNGYATFAVGKWHAAPLYMETPAGPFEYRPLGKGFDRFYGFLEGETDQYSPQLIYDNHNIDPPRRAGYHLSADLVDHSMQFISDQVSVFPEQPFFLYLCFGVAHSPHQVPPEYRERYKGLYAKGWDAVREERFRRQIQLGIVPEGTVLTARDSSIQVWDELEEERKELYQRFQETYAGFITHCDEQVGRLISFLKEIGEYDNSLMILISDNGASRDGGTEGVDDFIRTLNGSSPSFEDLFAIIDDIGGPEVRALYPKGWASVSNTPFKEYKGTAYGGAVRCPLIVHWGEGIREKGSVCSQFVNVCDVTPTVLDVVGAKLPATINDVEQMPLHGVSFAQTFQDAQVPIDRNRKYYLWANTRGYIEDGWKAVAIHHPGKPFEEDTWELYNLNEDFAEAKNIAEQYPEKLRELICHWFEEAKNYITLPLREICPQDREFKPVESPANRSHFRYLPMVGHLGCDADPHIENRSHRITVPLHRDDTAQEGVLVAAGGNTGGYTLYIMDNRLIYEFNHFRRMFKVASEKPLPVGDCTVSMWYEKRGVEGLNTAIKGGADNAFYDAATTCVGIAHLYVDDEEVASAPVENVSFGLSLEGTDIGRDRLTPVTAAYKDRGEFAFSGTIKEVLFDLE